MNRREISRMEWDDWKKKERGPNERLQKNMNTPSPTHGTKPRSGQTDSPILPSNLEVFQFENTQYSHCHNLIQADLYPPWGPNLALTRGLQ